MLGPPSLGYLGQWSSPRAPTSGYGDARAVLTSSRGCARVCSMVITTEPPDDLRDQAGGGVRRPASSFSWT